MSVSSTVTVLSHGQSCGCVTLFDLSILASELAFGKAGSVSSNMVCREMGKFFSTLDHICEPW